MTTMTEVQPDKELAPYRSPVAGGDPRGMPQPALADEQQGANPVELIQERMHGRWLWAILLAAVLAPLAGAAGYLLAPEAFVAQGLIAVERRLDVTTIEMPETGRLDDFVGVVGEQAVLVKSDRVIAAALENARLKPFREQLGAVPTQVISKSLTAQAVRGTGFVTVEFSSGDPGFSAAVVNSVLEAFMEIAAPDAETRHNKKLQDNREALREVQSRVDFENRRRLELIRTTPYGSPDLPDVRRQRLERRRELEVEFAALNDAMARVRRGLGIADDAEPPDDAVLEPTELELDRVNPALPGARRQVLQAESQLDQAKRNYGERHPIRLQATRSLDIAEAQLAREVDIAMAAWQAGIAETSRYAELRDRRDAIAAEIERARLEITQIVEVEGDIAGIDRTLGRLAEEEEIYLNRIKGLEAEAENLRRGRVETTPALTPSAPSKDKRLPAAIAGGMGGVGLAFGLFFLLGTVDRRTYGTAQLSTQKGKLLLAGAIPDMDEVTGDVEGTELATNCVHRIRTRIESRRTPGDGYALMLSSPFQGDGKTTVAVALAWSYAESGSKTLLVDCDFIGQALSFQFGKLGVPGVREALQGAPVSELIAPLKNEKLSVLPIGVDRAFGAARAHPAALRRLFHDLRKEFEIIIVDTGPMTASIEALPVASAVDGVLLSLKRGRSRARLEECIQDILGVGAEYLGVVLNCADKKDCIRYGSVSRLSAELSRALEGKGDAPPRHPLLNAMNIEDGGGR